MAARLEARGWRTADKKPSRTSICGRSSSAQRAGTASAGTGEGHAGTRERARDALANRGVEEQSS